MNPDGPPNDLFGGGDSDPLDGSMAPGVDPALSHATSMFRDKLGELSLIRELSDCGAFISDPDALSAAIAEALRSFLNVDACALFEQRDGWQFMGGSSLDPIAPETVAPNLLDMASGASDGTAMTGKGDEQQVAVCLMQPQGLVGVLVITDAEAGRIWTEHSALAAIITRLIAALVGSAQLYRQVEDNNRLLETTLAERTKHLKETQERLHQQEKLASLGQLITGVSHELNNRLVPILGYAQLLKEKHLDGEVGKSVAAIEVAALGSKCIVDDLLSFARPANPKREAVDLIELLNQVKEAVAMSHASICPVSIVAEEEVPQVYVDPRQAEQLFHNLIKNALEALDNREDGHVRVGVRCDRGGCVSIVVEDNGCGMPEEVQSRIFEPFFSTKGVGKGTGLGLSITHGLVLANGGSIRVDSRNGFGSRFTISLPVHTSDVAQNKGDLSHKSLPEEPNVSLDVFSDNSKEHKKLLVVDDESGIRDFLAQALSRYFSVETAEDGLDAQRRLESGDFDVVLVDMRMPGQGGMALYRWINSNRPETASHVVFMTGDLYDQEANAFLEARDNAHLLKPFTLKELKAALKTAGQA